MGLQNTSVQKNQKPEYLSRGRNTLHTVFERHFADFLSRYDEEYAGKYGKFRLERIRTVGEHFLTCGDYRQGVARIRCSNPDCGHDYFRPFSCKGFYLCPSCSQKRTLLFAEHLSEKVLLRLPHRQFVFTFPKALRVFFRHDRRLFAEISKMIFAMVRSRENDRILQAHCPTVLHREEATIRAFRTEHALLEAPVIQYRQQREDSR